MPHIRRKRGKNTGLSKKASSLLLFIQGVIVMFYGVFVEWGSNSDLSNQNKQDDVSVLTLETHFSIYQNIQVMVLVGFTFSLSYLHKHSWNSVGVAFGVTAFCIQIYILTSGLWNRILGVASWDDKIYVRIIELVRADYAAVAVLTTFAALLGKVSVFQMLFITMFEVFFYSMNESIICGLLNVNDPGGSMLIHVFGCYFGLAASKIVSKIPVRTHPENVSSYSSNLFAFIGTLFLWVYWPSINSVLLTGNAEFRTNITTLFALIGSTFVTFMISAIYKGGKLHMEDILNATLSGGVMVGASANVIDKPYAAFIVGWIAGGISTFGYERLSQFLLEKIKLYDTAGTHNLHGIPGILGGFTSALFVGIASEERLGAGAWEVLHGRTPRHQAGIQIAALFITLGISIVTGVLTGLFLKFKWLNPPANYFSDVEFWYIDLQSSHGEENKSYASQFSTVSTSHGEGNTENAQNKGNLSAVLRHRANVHETSFNHELDRHQEELERAQAMDMPVGDVNSAIYRMNRFKSRDSIASNDPRRATESNAGNAVNINMGDASGGLPEIRENDENHGIPPKMDTIKDKKERLGVTHLN